MALLPLLAVGGALWGLIAAASTITAWVGEDVTLSCLFPSQAGMNLQRLTMTWQKELAGAEEIPVHSFYSGSDQLVTQAEAYRNRTQLDPKGPAQGNAALSLRGVRIQDKGIYSCYVYSELNWTAQHWELKVKAPYGEPHVTFDLSLRLGHTLLTFSSGGGYPWASVEWHDGTGTNLTEFSTTTETVDAQGLYHLCSKMAVPLGQSTNLTVRLMTDGKETPIQLITLTAGPGQSHNWTWQLVACLGAMTVILSVIVAVMLFCPPGRGTCRCCPVSCFAGTMDMKDPSSQSQTGSGSCQPLANLTSCLRSNFPVAPLPSHKGSGDECWDSVVSTIASYIKEGALPWLKEQQDYGLAF